MGRNTFISGTKIYYRYADINNMPRAYTKKKSGPVYTVCDVQKAVADVVSGLKTYRQASLEYKVPSTVLFNRIKGRKTSINHLGAGRQCDLTQQVEDV